MKKSTIVVILGIFIFLADSIVSLEPLPEETWQQTVNDRHTKRVRLNEDDQDWCLKTQETLDHILSFVVYERDPNFMAVNKRFYEVGMAIYGRLNAAYNHSPWESVPLNPRALYVFNSRYRHYLGLFNNLLDGPVDNYGNDRLKFESLHTRLQATPFLEISSISLTYAKYLQLSLAALHPTYHQRPFKETFQRQRIVYSDKCVEQLTSCMDHRKCSYFGEPSHPNEVVLYFHFLEVSSNNAIGLYNSTMIRGGGIYRPSGLKSSFLICIDKEFWDLKSKHKQDLEGIPADTWITILSLEPARTKAQRAHAQDCFWREKRYDYLCQYYDEAFHTSKFDTSCKFSWVEFIDATKANIRAGNYQKAYMFYNQFEKFKNDKVITLYQLKSFMKNYMKWGLRVYIPLKCFDKAVEIAEKSVEFYDKAISDFEVSLKESPNRAPENEEDFLEEEISEASDANYRAGKLYALMGNVEKASQLFERSAHLGSVYLEQSFLEEEYIGIDTKTLYRQMKSFFKTHIFSQMIRHALGCLFGTYVYENGSNHRKWNVVGDNLLPKQRLKVDRLLAEARKKLSPEQEAEVDRLIMEAQTQALERQFDILRRQQQTLPPEDEEDFID